MLDKIILPAIYLAKYIADHNVYVSELFSYGIINLSSGCLSNTLFDESDIDKAINHLRNYVLKQPVYSQYELFDIHSGFYYKLKNIMYSRSGDEIIISLKIPLKMHQSFMT